ncbi:hypothetical protein HNV12_00455 [Methanococcoides sp. SA1]|nr:hypothetical protein [Methanococcoides sp. SA1]
MLEKLAEKKYEEIEEDADKKRREIDYFVGLINSNYEEFAGAFSSVVEKKFKDDLMYLADDVEKKGYRNVKKEFFENALYSGVSRMVRDLDKRRRNPTGLITCSEEMQTPGITLGFYEYFNLSGQRKGSKFGRKMTKKGRVAAELYRKALESRD